MAVGASVGAGVMTGVAVGSGVGVMLPAGAEAHAVRKIRDARITAHFFITYLIERCPVGAAHVRHAAVWQTTAYGKAEGRACQAPTAR